MKEQVPGPTELLEMAQRYAAEWDRAVQGARTLAQDLATLSERSDQVLDAVESYPAMPEAVAELDRAMEVLCAAVLQAAKPLAKRVEQVDWVVEQAVERARSLAAAAAARKDRAAGAGARGG